jgi:F-type H+-transporting ATPase subunit gamma
LANLQDIRRRIKSVKSIQQITKAMKMVAAARLRRAQEAAVANQPYAAKMRQVITDIAGKAGDFNHPLLESREEGKSLYLVIASDKGLAGAYASSVFKETTAHIEDKSAVDLVTVGRKTREHFGNRDYTIVKDYIGISERPQYDDARKIALDLVQRFTEGEYKEIHMVYTRFVSVINSVPTTIKLLPFGGLGDGESNSAGAEYIYEPSAGEVLGFLLPQYLVTTIYAALLQASASELSSRMTAMSNATDNAQELIQKLDLHYNKVRQANITREITEIVGGAEALK